MALFNPFRRMPPSLGVGFCALAAIVLGGGSAQGAERRSALYCVHDHGALRIFAGQIRPDRSLKFAISLWDAQGQNIGVFGVATPRQGRWEFVRRVTPGNPDAGCRVVIDFHPDGTTGITGDPKANCRGVDTDDGDETAVYTGGAGTAIGSVSFSQADYRGPVRGELADASKLYEDDGALAARGC